jgi:hypothetical protein
MYRVSDDGDIPAIRLISTTPLSREPATKRCRQLLSSIDSKDPQGGRINPDSNWDQAEDRT